VAGVVVGVHRAATGSPIIRWAAEQARRRHLPLTLVHAWREPISLTLRLDPHDLPELDQPAQSHAEPGRAANVLLAQPAQLLVLGGHHGSQHLRHAIRLCVERARSAVVVVPEDAAVVPARVVVGVDYTPSSDAALFWAVQTADLLQCPLTVVHCWQWRPHGAKDLLRPGGHMRDQQRREVERLRDEVQLKLGDRAPEDVRVVQEAPLDGLIELVDESSLLVLGQRSHAGLGKLLSGAVGDDLSGLAPCAVTTVPTQVAPQDGSTL
jgi:nucleotide-binding universal stress UspA family protein